MVKHITIGGEPRPVRFTINALLEFEQLTGLDIMAGLEKSALSSLKNLRALAFVGLKYGLLSTGKDVDFTIENVGDWIGFGDGSIPQIIKAFTDDQPEIPETETTSSEKN